MRSANTIGRAAQLLARVMGEYARDGWINICSAVAAALRPRTFKRHWRSAVEGVKPRPIPNGSHNWPEFSGLEALTIRPESNFQMVGERTNVTGSPKF